MPRRVLYVLFFVFLFSGCTSYRVAKDVRLVAFDSDPRPGTALGPVKGEHCGYRVFGLGPLPSYAEALNALKSQQGVRYVSHMNVDRSFFGIAIWDQSCWTITGEGFK